MSIEVGSVSKSISFKYDNVDTITGELVTVFAKNPASGEELEEKKTVPNDGTFALAFPLDYEGDVTIELHGSDEGEDSETLHIGGDEPVDEDALSDE